METVKSSPEPENELTGKGEGDKCERYLGG